MYFRKLGQDTVPPYFRTFSGTCIILHPTLYVCRPRRHIYSKRITSTLALLALPSIISPRKDKGRTHQAAMTKDKCRTHQAAMAKQYAKLQMTDCKKDECPKNSLYVVQESFYERHDFNSQCKCEFTFSSRR